MNVELPAIHFKLDANYPENFPTSIHPSETVNLSFLTLKEAFESAQQSFLPYYSLTVVESGEGKERFFQVYDTSFFATFQANSNPHFKDPMTDRPIQKIHYFAMRCFKMSRQQICEPIDLQTDKVQLLPLNTDQIGTDIKSMLLDSVNANIFLTGEEDTKKDVRRMQYIIANLIKRGDLFSHLEGNDKLKETLQWQWCSSQGSYQGLVNLVQECLEHLDILPNVKPQLIKHLKSKLYPRPNKRELSPRESLAVGEAQRLIYQLNAEASSSPHSSSNKNKKNSGKHVASRNWK